ncbi:putative DNA binding domain-containing protein [Candidatus Sumerlaeota bacterium]|nr:putative DNA binding domain-containing protein [Candidatus Sumerlaeota bacterium]
MKNSDSSVIYYGPKYTFAHEAALKMFPGAQYFYERSPRTLFDRVDSGELDFGVLPVENSATGIVFEFFPLLVDQPFLPLSEQVHVRIVKELYLPIYQHLLSRARVSLNEVRTIYTGSQPYLQCIQWIERNLPNAKIEFVESTAAAAERLLQDPKGVCIGGNLLAKEEKLVKVRENINPPKNVTRFFAISAKHTRTPGTCNKSTFAVIIPDRVGTLCQVLQLLSKVNISLTNIKTLPVRAPHIHTEDFKDWFVIDVAAHCNSASFRQLKAHFSECKENLIYCFKFLGSYVAGFGSKGPAPGLKERLGPEAPPKQPVDKMTFFSDMIRKGESESVEFKASLRFDYKTKSANRELAKAVAKSLCGFMNSNGGYLFIGVSDTGDVLGIQEDINTLDKRKTADGFLAAFYQVVSDFIGKEFSHCLHAEVLEIREKKLCCVRIEPSTRPAWLRGAGEPTFFIRVGNSCRPLNAEEATGYVMSRFVGK